MKKGKAYVISNAVVIFSARGPKSVTMDEVAAVAGISKRTLYGMFATKELLVAAVAESLVFKNEQFVRICTGMSPNALIELNNLLTHINKLLLASTPVLLYELKKYYPQTYEFLDNFINTMLIAFVNKNIERGIAEGIYRPEVEKEGAGSLYCWQLKKAMEDCSYCTEDIQEMVFFVHNFFIHGILNAKGLKLLTTKPEAHSDENSGEGKMMV